MTSFVYWYGRQYSAYQSPKLISLICLKMSLFALFLVKYFCQISNFRFGTSFLFLFEIHHCINVRVFIMSLTTFRCCSKRHVLWCLETFMCCFIFFSPSFSTNISFWLLFQCTSFTVSNLLKSSIDFLTSVIEISVLRFLL